MHCNSHCGPPGLRVWVRALVVPCARLNRGTRCDVHPTVGIFEAVDCNGAYHLGVSARPILR